MGIDFKSWITMPVARVREVLEKDYLAYAQDVSERFESETYQKVVTYCLLQAISPATTAQIIKQYITKGKLPWSR